MPGEFRRVLARGHDNEVHADDGDGVAATRQEAERALADAARFIGAVTAILTAGDQSA